MFKLYLTFDCEDFINLRSINSLHRILELLQKYDLKGIFFITGLVSERLTEFPKVLDLLEEHEIGYHSAAHSVHPTIFQYTDIEDYQVAYHSSLKRETARINPLTGECEGRGGFVLLKDLFPKKKIVSFRAPGFCWSPPHLEALETLGVRFDFSAHLSPIPVHYKKTTFYPLADGGYGFKIMARSFVRSVLTFRHAALREYPQYIVLLLHPSNFTNAKSWDSIYYNGNPEELYTVPPKSEKETKIALQKFELFLKRISFLANEGALEITPPLQKGICKTHFKKEEITRCYRRSVQWAERFFNYKPKFLLRHFLRYFDLEEQTD